MPIPSIKIFRLSPCIEEGFPAIKWKLHGKEADRWLAIDKFVRAGEKLDASHTSKMNHTTTRGKPKFRVVDCIDLSPGIGVSERTKKFLEGLDISGLQFIPFLLNGERFHRFFTRRCVDCLDYNNSVVEYFESDPSRVMRIHRYRFDRKKLDLSDIFTIPEESNGMFFWSQSTYVTLKIKEAMQAANLIGFRFDEVEDYRNPLASQHAPYLYENKFLGIKLPIPDCWATVDSQKKTTGCGYQTNDDDLPKKPNESRFLVVAEFHRIDSPAIIEAGIELSIYREEPGTNMPDVIMRNAQSQGDTVALTGTWEINGTPFWYCDEILENRVETGTIRFVCTPLHDNLWLYAKIAGYSPAHFKAAITVFESLSVTGI